MGKPRSKAGVFAHEQAKVVACNIAQKIKGAELKARFDGSGARLIEAGGGRVGFGAGNFCTESRPQVK